MEGTALELKEIIEFCKNELNIDINEIRVSGGVSRSRIWRQIRADVTQVKIAKLAVDDATLLGDAIFAMIASGITKDVESIIRSWVRIESVNTPNLNNREIYDKCYRLYKELYGALRHIYSKHVF